MIGQRLDDLKLRERYGANVIGVERAWRFRRGDRKREWGIGFARDVTD